MRHHPAPTRSFARVALAALAVAPPASAQAPSVVDYTPTPPTNATWPVFVDVAESMGTPGTEFANAGSGRGQAWVDIVGPDPSAPETDRTGPPDGVPDLIQINSNSPALPLGAGPGNWVTPPIGEDQHPCIVYRGNGDGTFTDVSHRVTPEDTEGFGLDYPGGSPWGAVCADYDGDGDIDVFVPCGGFNTESSNALFRNDGDGTLTNATAAVGMGAVQPTFSACWLDYDRDGDLDLFETNAGASWPEFFQGSPVPDSTDRLHRNDDGTFVEVGAAADVDLKSNGFSCVSSDLDRDGWPDLVVSCFRQFNKVFYNEGDGTFAFMAPPQNTSVDLTLDDAMVPDPAFPGTEELGAVPPGAGALLPLRPVWSMPVEAEDVNADGWPDLLFTAWSMQLPDDDPTSAEGALFSPWDAARLYLNRGDQDGDGLGDGLFREVSAEVGIHHVGGAMGLAVADLNGDGYPDAYVGCGGPQLEAHAEEDYLYVNDGAAWPRNFQADPDQPLEQVFHEVGALAGTYSNIHMAHGLTVARPGSPRLDVLIGNGGPAVFDDGQPNVYFRNDGNAGAPARYFEVDLVAGESAHYGARVELLRTPAAHGPARVVRERRSGEAFASHNDDPLLFGLGDGLPLWAGVEWTDGSATGRLVWPATGLEELSVGESDLSIRLRLETPPGSSTTTMTLELEQQAAAPLTPLLAYLVLGLDASGAPVPLALLPVLPSPFLAPYTPFEASGGAQNLPEGLHAIVAMDPSSFEVLGTGAAWHDPEASALSAPATTSAPPGSGPVLPWSDAKGPALSEPHEHVGVGDHVELTADTLKVSPAQVPTDWRDFDLGLAGSLELASGDRLVWKDHVLWFHLEDSTPASLSFGDGTPSLTTGRPMGCCDRRPVDEGQLLRFEGIEGMLDVDGSLFTPAGQKQLP